MIKTYSDRIFQVITDPDPEVSDPSGSGTATQQKRGAWILPDKGGEVERPVIADGEAGLLREMLVRNLHHRQGARQRVQQVFAYT